ncbi:MAG: MBL fold metallo-hydrolase [Bacteroidales bacterium]|nr:MBL fold metallo-hydrolase [Bacteroidales bacterium]
MLQLENFVFNPFAENTYVVYDEASRECVIIDPGCQTDGEVNQLCGFIDSHRLKPLMAINTHGHIDHIIGNAAVKEKYGVPVAAHHDAVADITQANRQAVWLGFRQQGDVSIDLPDSYLTDCETIKIGESTLEVICTPGHARGSISLYAEQEGWVFTGDALFCRSIGRTDLSGGNYETLRTSIKERLFRLPDDTTVFPGHGESTTIFDEQRYNMFL